MRAGLGPEDFWHATPDELGRYLEGVARARRDTLDYLTVCAWQMVAFDRTKRLPDLRRLMDRRAQREEAAEPGGLETKEQLQEKWRTFFARAQSA